MTLRVGTRLGPYEIAAHLGAGGMGEVYRARDTRLDRTVAIKVISTHHSAEVGRRQRFEREARAIAALQHPNICTLYDVGHQGGTDYLVMEYLEGETLASRLTGGPLTLDQTVSYGIEIADALDIAHHRGIVHRDLKPGNIFITTHGESKVLDFGLAKLEEEESGPEMQTVTRPEVLTSPGMAVGTVAYMSPEQARGDPLDARTDIFSLGSVLYEMVTGRLAFRGKTSAVVFKAILDQTPMVPTKLVPNLPERIDEIVAKALEKDRDLRYQSAADLRADLNRLKRDSTSGRVLRKVDDTTPTSAAQPRSGMRTIWLVAAVAILALAALGLSWRMSTRKPPTNTQVTQRQLTAGTTDNPVSEAVISRDGKYLAYKDEDGISIQEIENGDSHKLPKTAGLHPQDWYPDGLHLLVTDDHDLWTLFAASGETHKLASGVSGASISFDGSQILLFREGRTHELWSMPSTGGESQLRLDLGRDKAIVQAAWSPDSESIVYISTDSVSGIVRLEAKDLRDGKTRVILTNQALIGPGGSALAWVPEGRIVFGLRRESTNDSDLWVQSLDGNGAAAGKPVRLTNVTSAAVGQPSVSTDGKRLAIVFLRFPFAIFVGNLSKTGESLDRATRLTPDAWNNWPRAWTPDGQTLFYVSSRRNKSIYKRQISSEAGELFLGGPENYSTATVSPDGAWVLAISSPSESGRWQMLRVPASGGSPESRLELEGPARVQCAVQGARICVISEAIGKQDVFTVVDPLRGRLEELAKIETQSQDSAIWSLSPDGGRVALAENSDNVRLLNLQNKQVQLINPTPAQTNLYVPAWSADGKHLYVSAFPGGKGKILEMDLDGHTHTIVENPHGWMGYPLPSPDGKRLAYIYAVTESNVALLEHF